MRGNAHLKSLFSMNSVKQHGYISVTKLTMWTSFLNEVKTVYWVDQKAPWLLAETFGERGDFLGVKGVREWKLEGHAGENVSSLSLQSHWLCLIVTHLNTILWLTFRHRCYVPTHLCSAVYSDTSGCILCAYTKYIAFVIPIPCRYIALRE